MRGSMDVAGDHGRSLELHPLTGDDRAADLSGHYGLLGMQVTLDDRADGHQHLGTDAYGPAHSAFDPDHALGLEISDDGHVARDDRERDLIRAPATELVALLRPSPGC